MNDNKELELPEDFVLIDENEIEVPTDFEEVDDKEKKKKATTVNSANVVAVETDQPSIIPSTGSIISESGESESVEEVNEPEEGAAPSTGTRVDLKELSDIQIADRKEELHNIVKKKTNLKTSGRDKNINLDKEFKINTGDDNLDLFITEYLEDKRRNNMPVTREQVVNAALSKSFDFMSDTGAISPESVTIKIDENNNYGIDEDLIKQQKSIQDELGPGYENAKLVGIIPRFKGDIEKTTTEVDVISSDDVISGGDTFDASGRLLQKPVEERVVEEDIDLVQGKKLSSGTKLVFEVNGKLKYVVAPKGIDIGGKSLSDFEVDASVDVKKPSDYNLEMTKKINSVPYTSKLYNPNMDAQYFTVNDDGTLELDVNLSFDKAAEEFADDILNGQITTEDLAGKKDKNTGASDQRTGFNYDTWADFGFYYNEEDGKIYANVELDADGEPVKTNEGIIKDATTGQPAKSMLATNLDADQIGIATPENPQEWYNNNEANRRNYQSIDRSESNKDLVKFLIENKQQAKKSFNSDIIERDVNAQTQRDLEFQQKQMVIINQEVKILRDSMEGPSSNTSMFNTFRKTSSNNQKLLNDQLNPIAAELTTKAAEIDRLFKMHENGESINVKGYNKLFKQFEADRANYNRMVEVLDMPMTEEYGWYSKGGKRPYETEQGKRSYDIIVHKDTGLEIVIGYNDDIDDVNNKLYFDRQSGNALTVNEYIKQQKEYADEFAINAMQDMKKLEYLGFLYQDASLSINKRYALTFEREKILHDIAKEKAKDNATFTDYSKRTLNQFTSNYFRAMSGFVTSVVRTMSQGGNLVGLYDEKDMKTFDQGIKQMQQDFVNASSVFAVDEDNVFRQAFSESFAGKAHSAMVDMIFDVLVTKGLGKSFTFARNADKVKKAKALMSTMMKTPTVAGVASLASMGGKNIIKQTVGMMTNPMFLKIANEMDKQMQDPRFNSMSRSQKYLYTMGTSFVMGKLEQLGIEFATEKAGGQVINHILEKAFSTGGKNIARNVDNIILKYMKDGAIKTGKFVGTTGVKASGEGFTELTQEVFDWSAANMLNYLKGYNGAKAGNAATGFYKPDFFSKENMDHMFETFALGAIATGPVAVMSTTVQMVQDFGAEKLARLADSQWSSLYVFRDNDNIKTYTDQMMMKADDEISKAKNVEEATEIREKYADQIKTVENIHDRMQAIDPNLSSADQRLAYSLLTEMEAIEKSLINPDGTKKNAELNKGKYDRIKTIKEELSIIGDKADQNVQESVDRANETNNVKTSIIVTSPDQDTNSQITIEDVSQKEIDKAINNVNNGGAAILQNSKGEQQIIVSKDTDIETLLNHEKRHEFFREALAKNPQAGKNMVDIIRTYLSNSPGNQKIAKEIEQFYEQYKNDPDYTQEELNEEFIMLFADRLTDKNLVNRIKDDRSLGQQLKFGVKDIYRRAFNIPIKEPKNIDDVIDLIKESRSALETGKKSKRLQNFADKGFAEDANIEVDPKSTTKEAKAANTEIKQIGEQINSIAANANTAADVQTLLYNDLFAEDAPPKTSNLVDNIIKAQLRKNGIDVDKADATVYDQPLYGADGIMQEIKSHFIEKSLMRFNPEKNDNVGGFVVSELVNYRIGDITNKYKPKQGTISIDKPTSTGKAFDVEDTNATSNIEKGAETRKAKVTPKSKLKSKVPSFVDQSLEDAIETAVLEIREGVRPKANSKEFLPFVKDVIEQKLAPTVKKQLGTGKNYIDFMRMKFIPKMRETMTPQFFVQLESMTKPDQRLFTKPPVRLTKQADIDKAMLDDKVYVENTKQGVNLYEFKDFTDKQLVDYLLPPLNITSKKTGKEVKSGLRGNRKTTIATGSSFELGKDMIPSIFKSDPELALISKKIQRDPRSMMMKKPPLNFTPDDILKLGELSRAFSKNDVARILDLSKEPINEKTRDGIFKNVLNAAKKGFLTQQVIEAGKMGSGGRQTFYGDVNSKYSNYAMAKKKGIDKVKKYFKTTTGEYIQMADAVLKNGSVLEINKDKYKKNVNSRVDYVPIAGRLFWGNKDPNYQELIKEANKNGVKPSLSKRIGVIASGINKKWFESNKDQAKRNMNELKEVALALEKAVASGMDINVANSIITQSYQATSGLIKISAGFKYRSRAFRYGPKGSKVQQRKGNKYREEHNPPASVLGASLLWAIQETKVNDLFPYIEKNFYQTQLSKFDDSLLDFAKLDSMLPEGITILDNPIIRLSSAKINLNDILNVETGKTIIEEFGLGVDSKFYNMPNVIAMQNSLVEQVVKYGVDVKAAKKLLNQYVKTPLAEDQNAANNYNIQELIDSGVTSVTKESKKQTLDMDAVLSKASSIDAALRNANKLDAPVKKIRVFDFDDTLATSNNKVFAIKGNETKVLNAEQFAKDGKRLVDEGYEMDFSDFDKVTEGGKGPLFDIAQKIKEARGNEDLFVLTARGPNSQNAIYEFLKAEGLEFKRENIVGLGNSTGAAKANWIIDKAAEGFNDFYFADDAYQNFKAVKDALSVIDIKSKVQQARVKESKKLSEDFNKLLEASTGVEFFKEYSPVKAKTIGASKGKFKFFIPYSAEDFMGLIYPTLGKGKVGDSQMAWYKKHLLDPYTRAQENLSAARLNLMNDFKTLKKSLNVPKDLRKKNDTGMTNEQAVRVFLYEAMGYDIPGLSKSDKDSLLGIVANDPKLTMFAEQILTITKGDGYATPRPDWQTGTITTDLIDLINTEKRSKYLAEWQENVDAIYSNENLNKLEALYGSNYREALDGILKRMKSGRNRLDTGNRLSNKILDYINGSIGTIMFFNTRSAVLQTISSINFINWNFNNPIKAGAAFANQPQYWKDFSKLINSDYLKDRRNGLKLNIQESEIADAAATSKNKTKAVLNYILQKGYLPTQYADSFAIASGGATFYRNRIKDLTKNQGMTEAEAEAQAMVEWRQIAEESQQSSDPSRISSQQSSDLGRIILAFANTPMQYARIQKRAIQDLSKGRGDAKTHISKIIYYGFLQNILFNALQQAVFAIGFGDDDDENEEANNKRYSRTLNGMLDSLLRGLGIGGAALSVGKNFLLDIYERSNRKRPEYVDSVWKLTQFSPPINSKISKLKQAAWQFDSKKRRQKMFDSGFSLDNPAYEASAKVISAVTNVPIDRLFYKMKNIEGALNEDNDMWQRIAMLAGWPEWQLKDKKKDAEIEVTPEQKEKAKASKAIQAYKAAKGSTDYDTIKKLTSAQQIKMLKGLGYGDYTIKNAKSEKAKIDLIIYKNKGGKIKVDKKAVDTAKYKALSKADQVRKLDSLGLSKADIKALKYEKDRVAKLLELMKK